MKKLLLLGAAVLLGVAAIIFVIQQTNTLDTTYFTWQSSRVPPEFEGFRIVQVSDLHAKRFGREQQRLLHVIAEAQPDLIVITGDMIDESTRSLDSVQELLAGLHGLAPIYFIDGNHDVRSRLYEDFVAMLERYGVTMLDRTQLERDGAAMTMGNIANADADIVLVHDPAKFLWYAEQGHDGLVLAGHMHGGQVALPNGRAIIGPFSDRPMEGLQLSFFPPFSSGVYVQDGATMFLSRGLGTSHLPIRMFATPEVAIIDLK